MSRAETAIDITKYATRLMDAIAEGKEVRLLVQGKDLTDVLICMLDAIEHDAGHTHGS